MEDLTRDQVAAMEREARSIAAIEGDAQRSATFGAFAAMCGQLRRMMDEAGGGPLKGVQIWRTVETLLAREKGRAGALVVVVPRQGMAGAGIGLFNLVETAKLVLPESRRAYFGEAAASAYETAIANAVPTARNPNGEDPRVV